MTRDTNDVQPLVSVVVPVFNGMPHLAALTASLLSQTYENLEIVFSEGGGTDGSADYLATITDPRVRVVHQPKGTTAAGNWTAATNQATGEFAKLVCQDDLLKPDAIANQVADLQAHPSAVMAIAQRDIVDAKGRLLHAPRGLAGINKALVTGEEAIRTCYLQGTNVIGEPLAVLFRTEALKQSMPWDDSNPLVLDLNTYAKVAPLGNIAIRHESIGAFRVSTSSWSTRLASVQLEQFRRWQREYERSTLQPPTGIERRRAAFGLHLQTTLRRGAYVVLRAKRSLRSDS